MGTAKSTSAAQVSERTHAARRLSQTQMGTDPVTQPVRMLIENLHVAKVPQKRRKSAADKPSPMRRFCNTNAAHLRHLSGVQNRVVATPSVSYSRINPSNQIVRPPNCFIDSLENIQRTFLLVINRLPSFILHNNRRPSLLSTICKQSSANR